MSEGHHPSPSSGGGSSKGFGNSLGLFVAVGFLVVVLLVAPGLLGWLSGDSESASVGLPRGQVTYSPTVPKVAPACPGIYQSFPLGATLEVIGGGSDCNFSFEVKMGRVKLIGPSGELVVGTGEKANIPQGARYTVWQAMGGDPAVVHAAFCKQGTAWDNGRKQCL